MNTSNHELTDQKSQRHTGELFQRQLLSGFDPVDAEQFEADSTTPLGQLLKLISSLPEIRHEKVRCVKRQINHGQYDIGNNLDAALDKVLEEFLTDD